MLVTRNNKGIAILLFIMIIVVICAIMYAFSPSNANNLNKKKKITFNNKTYEVYGMNEEIKKYIGTDADSCFGAGALIISERNNLYFGASDHKKLKVNKVKTDLDVYYITKDAIEPHMSGTGSCNELGLFVILSDKQVRPIKLKYNSDTDKLVASIADYDVKDIVYQLSDILLFKDNTLAVYSTFVKNQDNRIKYQNNTLKVDVLFGNYYYKNKIYNMDKIDTSKIPQPHTICHLAISNNKLYRLCGSAYGFEPPRNITDINVANEKVIQNYQVEEGENEQDLEKPITVTINYTDGTTDTYETKKMYFYEYKKNQE